MQKIIMYFFLMIYMGYKNIDHCRKIFYNLQMYFFLNCRFFHPPRESLKCILLLKNTTSKFTVLTNIYNMIFPDVKHASHKSRAYFNKI